MKKKEDYYFPKEMEKRNKVYYPKGIKDKIKLNKEQERLVSRINYYLIASGLSREHQEAVLGVHIDDLICNIINLDRKDKGE